MANRKESLVTYEEFAAWIQSLVQQGRLTGSGANDVLEQRRLFDQQRSNIETEFDGSVVGVVAGERITRRTTAELLDAASADFSGRLVYFEPIGRASWIIR
jgi:hypothetical protein